MDSQASASQAPDNADLKRACPICNKVFTTVGSKNKHMRTVHQEVVGHSDGHSNKNSHILCPSPSCGEFSSATYNDLDKHIEDHHGICLEKLMFSFSSREQYEEWMSAEKIVTNYIVVRTRHEKDFVQTEYRCNRSDTRGYEKKITKKITEKSGGTIKLCGVCPSALIVGLFNNGEVSVTYKKTHFGHDQEIRTQHLSKQEKDEIVKKLECGIPADRILADARKLETPKFERINLLNRGDVNYLYKKHNVGKKRDQNEMAAVALKVEEWNKNGQKYAFFFKQEGEKHELLRDQDFAIGFMNSTMRDKLLKFNNIICMDGTHCTNKKGMDLTIMLVKDDRNAGFPVAFFLSNRLDTQIQEVFLGALRDEIGQVIEPTYFMTDDDPKYYNAWVNVMGNTPRRLLCTWHVIKNWNIQGRAKIKDANMKKGMKGEMKKILNECNKERFMRLANIYFKKLEEENEMDFLNYLRRFYFTNEERVQMWAHCYRRNAGINTNMAVESLNNFLKSNQLKRKTKVTVEKLLDTLEELVDIKMWQRILNIERPNAGNYQDRICIKAHKKAEEMAKKSTAEIIELEGQSRQFLVKSSVRNFFYEVSYSGDCENECRAVYCRVCKVCLHRYQCECPEYAVKNTMCKHIHMVCMYEQGRGTNYVTDDPVVEAPEKESQIKNYHQEEINKFLQEKVAAEDGYLDEETKRGVLDANVMNFLKGLDDETHGRVIGKINLIMKETDTGIISRKRKMEKQVYYPAKRQL